MNRTIDKGTRITLTLEEMYLGALGGIMRRVKKWKNKRQDQWGAAEREWWQIDIEGALGELAFASAAGLYWRGCGEFHLDDIDGIEVRTASKHGYRLIVTPNDPPGKLYVLLTGAEGQYIFQGCIQGVEAKNDKYLEDPNDFGTKRFFVPQDRLNDYDIKEVRDRV